MTISPARAAAFDVLFKIENEGAFSSILLSNLASDISLLDRSLCHEIVMGTLRRQIYLDRLIEYLASGKKVDSAVRIAIRMGLFQLKWLDRVPAYSAINESVNLIQRAKKTSAKGFVNAILRRVSRETIEIDFVDEVEKLSVETSHPRWLVERWMREFGADEAKKICEMNNALPPLAFRILTERKNFSTVLESLAIPSQNVEECFLSKTDRSDEIYRLARESLVYVQEEASQMVANCVEIPPRGNFIDICASPGGKTGIVSRRFKARSNLIVAGDLRKRRVEFLRQNLRQQGQGEVPIVRYDAEIPLPFKEQSFDRVMLDAPCSGTGTIRRNPEIRYRLAAADIAIFAEKQLSILQNASKLVRPGGEIIYSTCSLERDENEDVCHKFLASCNDFSAVRPKIPERFLTSENFGRTCPAFDNMDGFFIACFRRTLDS